ncbi:MAG: hypothetical protein CML30_04365 [Rhizobiales bacterium]|nr:hypothetical protein [Hyphomicrobiales bacterium]
MTYQAAPYRADASPADLARLVRLVVAMVAATLVFVTFTPFPAATSSIATQDANASGDIVNQIGYLGICGLALAVLLTLSERRRLIELVRWQWLLMGLILVWSLVQSAYPDLAMRGVIFTLVAMAIAASVVLLPKTEADFRLAFTTACAIVLIVSYFGVLFLPGSALHLETDAEGHSGLWRGIYSHKNFAGPVMAAIALYGIYLWRAGDRIAGVLITLAAAYFVIKTGSKTTAGFLPLSVMVVSLRRFFGSARLVLVAHVCAVVLIAVLTIGSAFSPRIEAVTHTLIADTTFTGRDNIWEFGVHNLPEGLFSSYGFFGFWGTNVPLAQEEDTSARWDVRYIVSGHTNFIDAIMSFGRVPGAILVALLLLLPAFHYVRACRHPQNRRLADFFMMTVTLMGMISALETFFSARAMTTWLVFFIAVFGLSALAGRRAYWAQDHRVRPVVGLTFSK